MEDWKFRSGQLYRLGGWGTLPEDLVVTYTYGYATIPTPVVDLVVQLVLAALKKVEDDGMLGIEPGIRQESISEATYAVTYGSDEPVPISVFDLPARTRQWLRSTYGIGAVSVGGIQ